MKKKIIVDLGGEKRELKFGPKGLASIEAELGGVANWFVDWGHRKMAITLRGALLISLPNLTVDQVYKWLPLKVQGEEFQALTKAVADAYLISQDVDPDTVEAEVAAENEKNA